MFRIVCLVNDNKLAPTMKALSGLVVNMEPPQPVVNVAAASKDKVTALTNGSTVERVWAALPGEVTLNKPQIADVVLQQGSTRNNVNNVIKDLIELKRMKRVSRGVYKVGKK